MNSAEGKRLIGINNGVIALAGEDLEITTDVGLLQSAGGSNRGNGGVSGEQDRSGSEPQCQ